LTLLQNKGPLSLKNISAKLSLSAPSLCITLNKLVEEKYAERYVDENDRRNTYYQLLPKGEEYLNKERNNLMDYFDYRLSLLSEEDNHNFREHIMAIHKIMTELPNKQ
ncbi:MAG: MarR family transcriptional regulator, partial [Clostridiales bacterium]